MSFCIDIRVGHCVDLLRDAATGLSSGRFVLVINNGSRVATPQRIDYPAELVEADVNVGAAAGDQVPAHPAAWLSTRTTVPNPRCVCWVTAPPIQSDAVTLLALSSRPLDVPSL